MADVLVDEKVELSEDLDLGDGFRHTVHKKCHLVTKPLPEFVTAMCGQVLDWNEETAGPLPEGIEECPACEEAVRCPNCRIPKWLLP